MTTRRVLAAIGIIILIILAAIWLIRLFSERQLDDFSPEIPCSSKLIEKSDVLYVIPKFNGWALSKDFCNKTLALNKTIEMHGITHEYKEFLIPRNSSYIEQGIEIFLGCLNLTARDFKPGQLFATSENKKIIRRYMHLNLWPNQIFHKVYHCDDSGIFPNWVVDII